MAKYKKCPRCDMNWIPEGENLCEVCKAELGIKSSISLIEDEDEEAVIGGTLCPICKVNYINDDEEMCAQCRAERDGKAPTRDEKGDEVDEDWRQFVEEDASATPNEDGETSLDALQDEEASEDDEPLDDFAEDGLDTPLLHDDEEEEEDDDKDKNADDDFETVDPDDVDIDDEDEDEEDTDDLDDMDEELDDDDDRTSRRKSKK